MKKAQRIKTAFIVVVSLLLMGVLLYSVFPKQQVLTKVLPIVATPTKSVSPTVTTIPTPSTIKLSKNLYTIAILGDSMVDTMGENLEYVDKALKVKYPGVSFKLYNYGIGSQTVEMGLARFNSSFSNKTRSYPPITGVNADIIVLGSFSYNPFFPYDKNRHYLGLVNLINEAKKAGVPVYLIVEIAPLYDTFGQGPNGPNMTIDAAHDQANRIVEQLEGSYGAAATAGVPVIDVYSDTKRNGKFGNNFFTDGNDGIHPSVTGHTVTAEKIASTIKLK